MMQIISSRRAFLRNAAMSLAATDVSLIGSAYAEESGWRHEAINVEQLTISSWEDVKQINAGLLNVGYIDDGPSDGPVVILLHLPMNSINLSGKLPLQSGVLTKKRF